MVLTAIGFLSGILASSGTPLLIAGISGTIILLALRRVFRVRVAFSAIAFAAGLLDASSHHQALFGSDAHMQTLRVIIIDAHAIDDSGCAYTARLDDGRLTSFTVRGSLSPIGERFTLRAKRVSFDEARNPGEPAQRDIEAERGIVFSLEHVRIVDQAPPDVWDPTLWLPRARAWGSTRIHSLLGEPDGTILSGAMWGERGMLPPDLRTEFQDTGTVHVLVTAGLHLGVVAALAIGLMSWLGMGRITNSLATIPVIWTYAALSGAHLPSQRAATMLTFALVARAAGRDAFSWNGLALAAIVVAALHPDVVASLSFALSFSCVAAIFAFARPITTVLEDRGTHHAVAGLAGVALATQCGTWPLTVYGFLVIAPYAPLANAAVVPIVGIAMLTGFAALAASPIPWLAHAIANIAIALVDWIAGVVEVVARLPSAHIVGTPPPIWAIAAYDAALLFLGVALARNRFRIAACSLVAFATALCLWPPRENASGLLITAIDVGQADSILVQTPSGHAYLIDGGGRLESGSSRNGNDTAELIGERVVVPYLIRHGIHHLDAVLLSHPHGDHKVFYAH